jgi:hypothetical protein
MMSISHRGVPFLRREATDLKYQKIPALNGFELIKILNKIDGLNTGKPRMELPSRKELMIEPE